MSMGQAGPPPTSPRTQKIGVIVSLSVVILLIILLVLVTVPVSKTSSTNFSIADPGSLTQDYHRLAVLCPTGATASVSYASHDGRAVIFTIDDPFQSNIWQHNASSGSTTFTIQSCGGYSFDIYDTQAENVSVGISITTSSPIL
jgi:uncharacterized membrane protein